MTNSSLTIVVAAAPGLAKGPKLVRYTAPLPEVVVRPSIVLHTVGRNGYWVTATWSCWVDDGQEWIHDCVAQVIWIHAACRGCKISRVRTASPADAWVPAEPLP